MNEILKTIENSKNKLQALLQDKNNKKVLYNWLMCELAYTSNAIEGNTLTRKETARIIEEKITSSSKPFVHYQEAINHAAAFSYILYDVIKKDLPNYMKVPLLMNNFFEQLKTEEINNPLTAIKAHYEIVSIHPFVDGNGRCARLFMNLLLLKAGYAPIIIRPIDRKRYLDNIEKGQLTKDTAAYTVYMLSKLNTSLQSAINIIDIPKEDISDNNLLKVSEFASILKVRPSAVRYWVKEGKLLPYKYTEAGYMLFSKSQVQEAKNKFIIKRKSKQSFIPY